MASTSLAAGGREVFIRNLPFNATTDELEQLCSEIGPVKRASIIQGGGGQSRGFGFVKFAVPDDANRAAASLNGSDYKGRVLKVEIALKKGQKPAGVKPNSHQGDKARQGAEQEGDEDELQAVVASGSTGARKGAGTADQKRKRVEAEPSADPDGAAPPRPAKSQKGELQQRKQSAGDAAAARPARKLPRLAEDSKTLLFFNVSGQTSEKQLFKRVKKVAAPKSLKFEKLDDTGSQVAVVSFESTADSRKVQKKLDAHVVHGSKLAVRRLRSVGNRGGLTDLRLAARRAGRVIVRNLSFHATAQDLKESLGGFGPVLEAVVPSVTVSGGAQEKRGFGFVTFAYPEDAARAVASEGALKVRGREVAVDLCLGRQEYQQQRQQQKEQVEAVDAKEEMDEGDDEEGDEEDEDEEEDDDSGGDDGEEGEEETAGEEEQEDDEDDDDDHDEDDDDDTDGGADDDDEDKDDEKAEEEDTEKQQGKRGPAADASQGRTLFVRNVPFDATNETLKDAFAEAFKQPVAFAAVVKDRATGLSKGSAFVKFKSARAADVVLEASRAEGDGSVLLLGRRLKLDKAVDKDHAPAPSGEKKLAGKVDRRHLYLANEGLVLPGGAAEEVPQGDLDKRKREQEAKKTKLRNPLFFVSATRLSVRNLGRGVSDPELRAVMLEGARRGLQEGKVTTDDLRLHFQANGQAVPHDLKVPPAEKASVRVRVMRDLDRQPVDGLYPSRGYGFAEFPSHAYALAALRHVNNNPHYSRLTHGGGGKAALKPRLIVSFAVEDHRALKKKELRTSRSQAAAVGAEEEGGKAPKGRKRPRAEGLDAVVADEQEGQEPSVAGKKEERLSRGQRQRQKRRLAQEQQGLPLLPSAAKQQEQQQQPQVKKQQQQQQRGREALNGQRAKKGPKALPMQQHPHGRGGGAQEEEEEDAVIRDALMRQDRQQEPSRKKRRKEPKEDEALSSIVSKYKDSLFRKATPAAEPDTGGSKRANRWFDGI